MRRKWEKDLSSIFDTWRNTAVEMGFSEVSDQYYGFETVVDPEYGALSQGEIRFLSYTPFHWTYRGHSVYIYTTEFMTHYDVEFENPETILLKLKSHRAHISHLFVKNFQRMSLGDSAFDKAFTLSGNKESHIKAIFDPHIRSRLIDLKDTFFELTNMRWHRRAMSRNPKVISYTDYRRLEENLTDARKFRLIVDTVMDIVEKIEANTPSVY